MQWPIVIALAGALVLSGCLSASQSLSPWSRADAGSGPHVEAQKWDPGHWWGYRATFGANKTFHIALIVFEAHAKSFLVGSNLSAGFFGLPFNGNVTRPHLNPVIAGEEWRLFDFPLADGKRWTYPFMGYSVTAEAHRARLHPEGLPEHEGFVIEAKAYGRLITRYTYSPLAGWLTELDLYEPTNGQRLLHVTLEKYGAAYEKEYYVDVPLYARDLSYPAAPGSERAELPSDLLRLTGLVVLKGRAGQFAASLVAPDGTEALRGELLGQGVTITRKSLPLLPGTWRLDHHGLGAGDLHVEILALKAARGGATAHAPAELDETVDLLGALERARGLAEAPTRAGGAIAGALPLV